MAYLKSFSIPPMGEALDAARIVNWNVQPGQMFSAGDILLEIETDKSIIEVPAAESGKLVEQLVAKGELIDAENPVARLEIEGDAPAAEASHPSPASSDAPQAMIESTAPITSPSGDAGLPVSARRHDTACSDRIFATPAARRIAAQVGVDLSSLKGSGPGERITQSDVMAAARIDAGAMPMDLGGAGAKRADMETLDVTTSHGPLHVCRWPTRLAAETPTVVFIHGMFGDIDTWASTIASATRAGLGVVAIDLPCHGNSGSSVARFADIVDAVAEAIAKVCHGSLALVGHSLGAAVAVKVARRTNLHVRAVTLFSPVGLGTEINQSFLDGMVYARSDDALAREIGKLTAAHATPSATYLRKLRQRQAARTEPLAALCGELSDHGVQQISVHADLAALCCPVAIVHGRDDEIIPWQHALNASPRAALHLIPRAGHMPQAESMELACEIIERSALTSPIRPAAHTPK